MSANICIVSYSEPAVAFQAVQGPICFNKSRGVVNVNRTVAKPKGTLEIGVTKRSMGSNPPANRTLKLLLIE